MKILENKKNILLLLLMATGAMSGYAQDIDYFTYEDDHKTIITGLTYEGEDADELTIPSTVVMVRSGAFEYSKGVSSLMIDGGNPAFEGSLFGEKASTLTEIDMGNGMTVANMEALLGSLGTTSKLETIVIGGYSGDYSWNSAPFTGYSWSSLLSVTLPAALVADQDFGNAEVFGRFSIDKEIISFCTRATFLDEDTGSNMLFYVVDGFTGQYIHIKRVWFVSEGQGVLIHRTGSSSGYADLRRVENINDYSTERANKDKASYAENLLKGVTEPTPITPTVDEGTKTNLILKDGAFYRTSGGTVKANRAYLQVDTSSLPSAGSQLYISFDDEETCIDAMNGERLMANGPVYNLKGQRVEKPAKGLFIVNGRKVVK